MAFTNHDGATAIDPSDDRPYAEPARALPNFAGIWVDRNQSDIHIAVTGDIDGAIETLRPFIPGGITVYFHAFAHSYAELEALQVRMTADREELRTRGISTNFWAVDERDNVVRVGVDPLEPEVEQLIRERYGDAVVLEYSPESPPYLHTPWPTVAEVLDAVLKDDAEEFLTCGGEKFPASALDGPGGAEEMVGPVYDGLRETIRVFGTEFGGARQLSWIPVFQDETRANFMARSGDLWLEAKTELENGAWYAAGMGQCRPIVAPGGDYGPAEWALDPDYPAPKPADTEIHALVWELACSSGRPASGRMSPPTVEYLDDSLTIAIAVKPVPGAQECPGPPGTPVTFVLPQPVGDRTLLDGGKSPPASPTNLFGP